MRISSGRWRGRALRPPSTRHLRPSKGFVREVLFNWLGNDLRDQRVLDCFAGSGILSFEAVSRGARMAELWEIQPSLVRWLRWECRELMSEKFVVRRRDSWRRPCPSGQMCDVVFLDPPFNASIDKVKLLIKELIRGHRLGVGSKLYLERRQQPTDLGSAAQLLRHRLVGGVSISLWQMQSIKN